MTTEPMPEVTADAPAGDMTQEALPLDSAAAVPDVEIPKEDRRLLPHHRKVLEEASGIHPDVIAERGYWSAEKWQEAMGLRFSSTQMRSDCFPALMIPQYDPTGELTYHVLRYDKPRQHRDGRIIKYEQPKDVGLRLDVPPRCLPRVRDPMHPLWFTEGAKKADALASQGLLAVNTPGVDGWRSPSAIADLIGIPLKVKAGKEIGARGVILAYDSDVISKPAVRFALTALAKWTQQKGADVSVVAWHTANLPQGGKVGVDDYLTEHDINDLYQLLMPFDEWLEATKPRVETRDCPYQARPEGLLWLKPDRQGLGNYEPTMLANFAAKITADISEDDGADVRRSFEIQSYLKERTKSFRVAAEKFSAMSWVTEQMGASAILYPGNGMKDHARAAIQLLSAQIPERIVFTHLGWRRLEDKWFYLHADGAVGAEGAIDGVDVAINSALAGYQLPDPPEGKELVEAIRASLEILSVAPKAVMVPLLAAPYRAVIGNVDHSIHLMGPTGAGKSVLAALIQQFFGPSMDGRHLPAGWSSTGNALEMLAFLAKDALMVVDDFVPAGSAQDKAKLNREAERLFRGQGNQAGRQRLTADATLRHGKPPRGLILSTGEDAPSGQSLRARLLILEVDPSDIRWGAVTKCQRDAAGGKYSQVLSAFIKWLAPKYGEYHAGLATRVAYLRAAAFRSNLHRRVPEIVANLAIGLATFLEFALEVKAFTVEECDRHWEEWWKTLLEPAERQARYQAASEPARRFLTLLVSALSSGQAHLTSATGEHPRDADAWGWQHHATYEVDGSPVGTWQPQGPWIGWIDGDAVYLEPEAAFGAIQSLGARSGEPLLIASQTLHKRLKEKGYLASVDETRGTLTVRRKYSSHEKTRSVLHLHISSLYPEESTDISDIANLAPVAPILPAWNIVDAGPKMSVFPVSQGEPQKETDISTCERSEENRDPVSVDCDSTQCNVGNVGNVRSKLNGGSRGSQEAPGDSIPLIRKTDIGEEETDIGPPQKTDIGFSDPAGYDIEEGCV